MKKVIMQLRLKYMMALAAGLAAALWQPVAAQQARPNIVVLLVDQWEGRALGYLGKEHVRTPVLDSLSKLAYTATQMVSNFPVCSPARAMLLTGKYPLKNKVYTNTNSASAQFGIELPKGITCWSDVLRANGYSNGYIGKWHLEAPYKPYVNTSNNAGKVAWNEWTPPARRHGFDYWYAYNTYDEHNRPMYWDTDATREGFHYVDQWGPTHEADKAIDFLTNKGNVRKAGAPFSLVVSINPPHSPYDRMPAKYLEPYRDTPLEALLTAPNIPPAGTTMGSLYRGQIKNYYANMTGVDEQIGRILGALRDQHLLDNTIVLFTADHGNCLGKHNEESKNNIFEESLRVPFMVYWKGRVQPGVDNRLLASMPDIFPTLLDLAGLRKQIPADVDGTSLAPYLLARRGTLPAMQFLIGGIYSNEGQVNSGFRGVRTARYKLAYQRRGKDVEGYLFDLEKDPYELKNLYTTQHAEVRRLRPALENWLKTNKDPFELPNS